MPDAYPGPRFLTNDGGIVKISLGCFLAGSFGKDAIGNSGAGAAEHDEAGCVARAPAGPGWLDQSERHSSARPREPGPLGDLRGVAHGGGARLVGAVAVTAPLCVKVTYPGGKVPEHRMDDYLARVVGERVRFYRTAARKTKAIVAGPAGITPDYLYQIERGQKLPTVPVLSQLARALNVEPGDLLRTVPKAARQPLGSGAGETIYRTLTSPRTELDEPPRVDRVRREVPGTWATWQTSPNPYSVLTAKLPALIVRTETLLRTTDGRATSRQPRPVPRICVIFCARLPSVCACATVLRSEFPPTLYFRRKRAGVRADPGA